MKLNCTKIYEHKTLNSLEHHDTNSDILPLLVPGASTSCVGSSSTSSGATSK